MQDIRDIKPPVDFAAGNFWLLALIVIVVLALAVFLITYFLKKRKRNQAEEFRALQKPPHQIAYEALSALKDENLIRTGKIKQYYTELSNIIRRYVENRFGMKAPEMTTEEFLWSLRGSRGLPVAHKDLLGDFLNLCDIVKFAKYAPTQREIDDSFQAAVRFVDETKPEEEKEEISAK